MQSTNRISIGILWILWLGYGTLDVSADEVDVYLFAGQSNMQGLGRIQELDDSLQQPFPHTFFWNGTEFELFQPKVTKLSERLGEFGPEIGFVETLRGVDADRAIYLIKFHRSGQALDAGWDGGDWKGDPPGPNRATFYPGDSAIDPHAGMHYRDWIGMCRVALDSLSQSGHRPRIRGVAWMQGEQDAKQGESASRYAASLRQLRQRVQEDLQCGSIPWVYGQVLPHEPAMDRFAFRPLIREQMWKLDERSCCKEASVGLRMVSTDYLSLLPDTVHYDSTGQRELGNRFALAMLAMVDLPDREVSIADWAKSSGMQVHSGSFHEYPLLEYSLRPDVRVKVACPRETAIGRPWILRARFWGHRPEFDVEMLRRGWHVVYCDVADLYGSDEAIRRWDFFYDHLQSLGFHRAPILEGMSRGGLIAMRWASAHPERVAGIYLDNAVMDIRSWPGGSQPGGYGTGPGSKEDWIRCLKAYGLSPETVIAFRDGPLDRLKLLADNHVPIYALVNQADHVVPPEENGNRLGREYRELGGPILEHPRPELDHHPHGLDDPTPIVNFALESMIKASHGHR